MSAPTLADCFSGVVETRKWTQPLSVEWEVLARNLYFAEFEERHYSFIGVPASLLPVSGSVSVTDVGNVTHLVPLDPTFIDGSSGTAIVEKDSVSVNVQRMSPHLWRVDVVRRVAALKYNNGSTTTTVYSAPSFSNAPGT